MKRSAPLRRTRMRRIGPKGRAKAKRLDAIRPLLEARSGGRCEHPLCRRYSNNLDRHHLVKRSQGGADVLENLVLLCRFDHRRLDLPDDHPRHLSVHPFTDDLGRVFACFQDGAYVECVPLAVPEPIVPTGTM